MVPRFTSRKLNASEAQVLKIRQQIANKDSNPNQKPLDLNFSTKKTSSGRAKRGELEKMVINYLVHRNGNGGTTPSIASGIGARYGSTYRVLDILAHQGKVKRHNDLWFWNG